MRANLDELVSAHQLISYPSEDSSFNREYEEALRSLKNTAVAQELYVVQGRANGSTLCFCSVPSSLISDEGPYFLTDIRALVRELPTPRLVLHADCTTCGPVCDVDSNAELVSQSALVHVAQTGHVVVLNGTADIPE